MLIISGITGSGKTTVANYILEEFPDYEKTISATTRPRRTSPLEEDGVHYYFLTEEEFSAKVANGEFIETNTFDGYRYGTLWSEIRRIQSLGKKVLLVIDYHGIEAIKKLYGNVKILWLFVTEIVAKARIMAERGVAAEELEQRFRTAQEEKHWMTKNLDTDDFNLVTNHRSINETFATVRLILSE